MIEAFDILLTASFWVAAIRIASPLIFATMGERMTERNYDVNFALDLMRKDLSYAQAAAGTFHVPLSTAANAEQLFIRAQQQGHGEQDMSAVVEVLRADKPSEAK